MNCTNLQTNGHFAYTIIVLYICTHTGYSSTLIEVYTYSVKSRLCLGRICVRFYSLNNIFECAKQHIFVQDFDEAETSIRGGLRADAEAEAMFHGDFTNEHNTDE
jgi:hypothetical protein